MQVVHGYILDVSNNNREKVIGLRERTISELPELTWKVTYVLRILRLCGMYEVHIQKVVDFEETTILSEENQQVQDSQ